MDMDEWLKKKFEVLGPSIDERQRRLVAAADALYLGHGGVSRVARASGLSRPTIHRGLRELTQGPVQPHRVRRPGGGRKRAFHKDPTLVRDLEALVDPTSRGDPESPLRWTCKSTRQLAQALGEKGHEVSHRVVADLLHQEKFSLQANMKTLAEGADHPDRDAQFRYIYRTVAVHRRAGQPVISVDTKKKELVGQYKNGGREWRPEGDPEPVSLHDFADPDQPKAIPYGVYDEAHNLGWVNVGVDHDTAMFAVASIRRWWDAMGAGLYPGARRLLICADSGGSNGYRIRLWKYELQRLATDTGMDVTVCHFPPGTSKWNRIEHRLFSQITLNWRGRPLISHEVIVSLIAATTTKSGLKVEADLDQRAYPTKVRVGDDQMAKVRLRRHKFHGDWNYTIRSDSVPL
jgi:transposase